MSAGATSELLSFLHGLRFEDLSPEIIARTQELFIDWMGSALAGNGAGPVRALYRFARDMGPVDGPCELLGAEGSTTPYFAALVNAAASHVVEQDDLHNRSVVHPGTVVFPAALATAQATAASGPAFLTAVTAGYEAGVRVGEMLGRSHYKVFHTTGTAGTVAAAVAVAHLLQLDRQTFNHAVGSAGTQAAGLWAFLRDAADSKQLHSAKAAADGVLAAYTARSGLTGARDVFLGKQGMADAMSSDPKPAILTQDLGQHWAVLETSFKWHASCRHTHPAADAMLELVTQHNLLPDDIHEVNVAIYQAAIDVLGPVQQPQTIHQSKFSMGFVLALIAYHRRASIDLFTQETLNDPVLHEFANRVRMTLDPTIDAAYPHQWMSTVTTSTRDGRELRHHIECAKGDPENPLTRHEIEQKALRLARYSDREYSDQLPDLFQRIYDLGNPGSSLRRLFSLR